jgi:hypothetical protein
METTGSPERSELKMKAAALFFLLVSAYMMWSSLSAAELPEWRMMAAAAALVAAIAVYWEHRKSVRSDGASAQKQA